jgi:flagellar biosynthesis/type III secretory pathway chaperone
MSVSQLLATLENLEKMHRSLLELANIKTEYIKAGDMESLDAHLKKEQTHVAAIETLEQMRQKQVMDYLEAKGLALAETPSIAHVIDITDGPEKEMLQQQRERLLTVVTDLKEKNLLNQKLVLQSLQFVNLTLDMLKPQRHQTSTFNYSGDEVRGQGTVGKKSYFDSQA